MIVVDTVVVAIGKLKRTKDMRNDIFQCKNVSGVKDRVRHSSDVEGD